MNNDIKYWINFMYKPTVETLITLCLMMISKKMFKTPTSIWLFFIYLIALTVLSKIISNALIKYKLLPEKIDI